MKVNRVERHIIYQKSLLYASYQIIRKVFPEAFAEGIEGVGLHPVRVNVA